MMRRKIIEIRRRGNREMIRNYKKGTGRALVLAFSIATAFSLLNITAPGAAQTKPVKNVSRPRSAGQGSDQGKVDQVGVESAPLPSGKVVYRAPRHDPFQNPLRQPPKPVKLPPKVKPFPPLEERLEQYKQMKRDYYSRGLPPPPGTSPYLVSELAVNGLYKTKDGYAVVVNATPKNLTYFARVGDKAYNGVLLRIDWQKGQVVYSEVTYMNDGTNRVTEVIKPVLPAMQASGN